MAKLFELESKIMDAWSVCNDCQTLVSQMQSEHCPTNEEIVSVVRGMAMLYHWKFEQIQIELEAVIARQGKE